MKTWKRNGTIPKENLVALKSECLGRGPGYAGVLSGGIAVRELESCAEEEPSFL